MRAITPLAIAGLTMTGATIESPFAVFAGPRHVGTVMPLDVTFEEVTERYSDFELGLNEGFAILLPVNASIAGDTLTGGIEWDEI